MSERAAGSRAPVAAPGNKGCLKGPPSPGNVVGPPVAAAAAAAAVPAKKGERECWTLQIFKCRDLLSHRRVGASPIHLTLVSCN